MSCVPRALSLKDVQEATAKDKILWELIIIIINSKPWEIKKKTHTSHHMEEYFVSGGASSHERNTDGDPTGTPGSCPQYLPWGTSRHCEEQTTHAFQSLVPRYWQENGSKMQRMSRLPSYCHSEIENTNSHDWNTKWIMGTSSGEPFPTGELVLVVMDERSRYPEIEIVNSASAESAETALEKIFETHGNPQILKSDNGRPINSHTFKELCIQKGIQHCRITPRWPEANGLVENFMKSAGKHSHGRSIWPNCLKFSALFLLAIICNTLW